MQLCPGNLSGTLNQVELGRITVREVTFSSPGYREKEEVVPLSAAQNLSLAFRRWQLPCSSAATDSCIYLPPFWPGLWVRDELVFQLQLELNKSHAFNTLIKASTMKMVM